MVLLDGLPGEEKEQQQHGDTEDCGAPTAHHRTQPTQAMSHQDAVTHTRREEGRGRREDVSEGKTVGTKGHPLSAAVITQHMPLQTYVTQHDAPW